jgi:hypothetical protein
MTSIEAWDIFFSTGKILDYLVYLKVKQNEVLKKDKKR